jgi:DNA-binding GntR family transcriptional regulator
MEDIGSRHRHLWEEIRDELRTKIVLGELHPGHRLIEEELAQRFGVSRGPVRSALSALERSGLVELNARRGALVTTFSARDVDEIFAVRSALEVLALETPEGRLDKDVLARLNHHLDKLEDAQAAGQSLVAVEADLSFHRELCRLSGNRRLVHAWQDLADQIEVIMAAVHRADPAVASQRGEHRVLQAALESGDLESAREALARHLDQSRSVMSAVTREGAARNGKQKRRLRTVAKETEA